MNSTELMHELYVVLKDSGALNKVNEFFREHPEYFSKGHDRYTASVTVMVSEMSDTMDTKNAEQSLLVSMTDDYGINRELTVYPDYSVKQRTWSVRPNEVCIISEVME